MQERINGDGYIIIYEYVVTKQHGAELEPKMILSKHPLKFQFSNEAGSEASGLSNEFFISSADGEVSRSLKVHHGEKENNINPGLLHVLVYISVIPGDNS